MMPGYNVFARLRAGLAMPAALAMVLFAAGGNVRAADEDTTASAEEGGLGEVVVTARKRAEDLQNVPVVVTALSQEQIRRSDLSSLEKIAAFTPNFSVGRASNGSGAQLTLRGIGSSSTSIGIEQSVAVVLDGVYYGQGRIIQEGFLDLGRIELLKGPQALFFGKNATAGVISLTSADPGPEREFTGRAGYEFESGRKQLEFVASAPLSDTFGIRLALRGSRMSGGYYDNISSPRTYSTLDIATGDVTTHIAEPAPKDAPGEKEILGRLTLKWTPNDQLTGTVKASIDHNKVNNSSWNYVNFDCASGVGWLTPEYECGDHFVSHQNNIPLDLAPNFPNSKEDGALYNDYKSYAFSGTLDWNLDKVDITSVSNFQHNNNQWTCACDFQSSNTGTWATEDSTWRAYSTELRALTTLDGPVNFLIGGLYQDTKRDFDQWIMFAGLSDSTQSAENEFLATTKTSFTNGETIAGFGQLIWKLSPTVEFTGGARYTHETKDSSFRQPYNNAALTFIFRPEDAADGLGIVNAKQTFNNWSPEATITWKPQENLTTYVAYKTGYKSGGFSNSGINSAFSATPLADLTFEPEKAKGVEGGIKSTLADNQVRVNFSVYRYKYTDLQVDFFNSPIFAFQTVTANARTSGGELEMQYAPLTVRGLSMYSSLQYNRAKYTSFLGPCYAGQTPAQGCTLLGPNNAPFQDLGGEQLANAPKWTAALGGNFERPMNERLRLGFSVDTRYSGKYLASGFGNPYSAQDSYVNIDAGLRLSDANDKWELALQGKNLTNEFYVTGVVDGPSSGSGTGTPAGIHADQLGFGVLPRTVQLQFTARF